MAPPTKEMLEIRELADRVNSLDKRLSEMTDAFRSLSRKVSQTQEFFQESRTHLEAVKQDVANLKRDKITNPHGDAKVTRF